MIGAPDIVQIIDKLKRYPKSTMQPLWEHKIRNGCRNRRENLFNPLKPQFMYCVYLNMFKLLITYP